MARHQTRMRITLAGISLFVILLAGCTSDENADSTTTTDVTETTEGGGTETTSTEGEQPSTETPSGTLRFSGASELVDLDPHGDSAVLGATVVASRQMYDPVVRFDGNDYQPNLATEWSVSDDGLTWTFTIRDDVTFHDGSSLTSEDVAASLNRVLELDASFAGVWGDVTGVEAPDAQTLTVSTAEPVISMVANMSLLSVLPGELVGDPGFFDAPIGSGPFKFEQWTPGDGLYLTANEDYFGGVPAFERVEMLIIPEVSSRVTALITGELDIATSLPLDQLAELEGNPDIQIENVASVNYYLMWFNHEREPFDNELVRRAMWHALDVESIVNDLFGETAQVADAPLPSTIFGHKSQQPYAYDPDLAISLLGEAGYPDGFSVTMDYNPSGPSNLELVQSYASYWAEVGIDVEINQKEQATWVSDLFDLNWDLNSTQTGVLTGEAEYGLARLYHSEAVRLGLNSAEIDGLLEEASTETDFDVRAELFGQVQDILWNEAHGIWPMVLNNNYVWRSDVATNINLDPAGAPLLFLATHP